MDARDAGPGGDSDAAVIGRSRGESEWFAVLFERHAASISGYVTRRVGRQAAEDIVAETFLTAFRQRAGYDLGCPDARPWLFGIAANLVRRHHRAESRGLRALARTGYDPLAESAADLAEARIAASEDARAVAGALAALSPEQRDVVLLVTWAELTFDQAAKALGVPAGTVRSRMNRARTRLRAALTATTTPDRDRLEEASHA